MDAIFIRHLDFRLPAGNSFIHAVVDGQHVIGVKHVDQIFVSLDAAHQLEPVLFGRGQRVFVRHDSGCGIFQIQKSDESFLQPDGSFGCIFLIVGVDRRKGILDQHFSLDPLSESRTGIADSWFRVSSFFQG